MKKRRVTKGRGGGRDRGFWFNIESENFIEVSLSDRKIFIEGRETSTPQTQIKSKTPSCVETRCCSLLQVWRKR